MGSLLCRKPFGLTPGELAEHFRPASSEPSVVCDRKKSANLETRSYRASLTNKFLTFDTCHRRPRRDIMPCAFKASALPRSDVTPCWRWRWTRQGPQVTGAVIARDLRREPDGARLRCILDPLPDANPELARWRMTNEVIAQDGGALRETIDIAFRRPDPARFADMLHVAGFRDITLMDETGTSRIRENEKTYLVLARTG